MLFTTQQVTGGARYSSAVLLGNYSEEKRQAALAARDFEVKRERGELLSTRKASQRAHQTQRVPLTFAADGAVRFGDAVQLALADDDARGAGHGGGAAAALLGPPPTVLSQNPFSSVRPGHARVTATAAAAGAARARNVFVLVRPGAGAAGAAAAVAAAAEPAEGGGGAPLRFGDRVCLASHACLTADAVTRLVAPPLMLTSARANSVLGTGGRGGRQDVTSAAGAGADTEWTVQPLTDDDFGAPVRAGAAFSLVHAMSNAALAAVRGETTAATDFGAELDVHAHTYRAAAHIAMNAKGELPPPAVAAANRWRFVLAPTPAEALPSTTMMAATGGAAGATMGGGGGGGGGGATTRLGADAAGGAFAPLSVPAVLEHARQLMVAAAGPHVLRSLALALGAADARDAGAATRDAARWALFDHGATLSDAEAGVLLAPFERAAHGGAVVDARALLAALRGDAALDAAPARAAAVDAAWAHVSGGGAPLTRARLFAAFDARGDPRVAAGVMTKPEAAAEFARQWPRLARADAPVSAAAFREYHDDVSAALPADDGGFELFVANAWRVPGAGTWRRKRGKNVLVQFHKGSATQAVIRGGEGIADDDFTALADALKAQHGLGGIARIKVLGLVEDDGE